MDLLLEIFFQRFDRRDFSLVTPRADENVDRISHHLSAIGIAWPLLMVIARRRAKWEERLKRLVLIDATRATVLRNRELCGTGTIVPI
jgi:hypothetical protein